MNRKPILLAALFTALSAQAQEVDPDAGSVLVAADAGETEADAGSSLAVAVADAGETEADAGTVTQDAGTPTPKKFVGLRGRITDARTGEGLIEATIKLVAGGKKSALTDVDGNYKLKLPPGTYDLRVFYELYEGRRISNIEVKPGELVTLDVALERDSRAVQEVVVEAKVDKRNESALIQERKKAAVVQDSLSAQVIAKTPDAHAGDAVKRVVGATLVDGKYVFIRGLGGRYTQTLLNSTLLPSPEPDEPSVPLDLFPVGLLSNLNVIKTYTPELPANFGGGSVTIDTNTFPTQLEVKVRAQFAGDTMTTFQSRPSEATTFGENLGFGSGSRALPSAIPTDVPVVPARVGSPGVTVDQQRAAAGAFTQRWTPATITSLPAGTFGATVGNTHRFGKESRLGYLVSAQVSRKERRQHLTTEIPSLGSGSSSFTTDVGSVSGATSVLANVGLQLNHDHELNAMGLYLWNAETSATTTSGFDQQETQNVTGSRAQFTQRQLFFNQLKGFHRLPTLFDAEVDWQLNYSRVNRDEPDIRDVRYMVNEDGSQQVRFQPNSLERFFLQLHEDSTGGTLNVTAPWRGFRFKVGGLGQYSARQFDGRRFRYFGRLPAELERASVEDLLTVDRFGPPVTAEHPITLEETTQASDRYTSSLAVYGGFVSTEWKANDFLRALAGVRVEGSTQQVAGGSPFATGVAAALVPVTKNYVDVVPTANVVLSPRSDVNVRLSYAYTLARPSFRELAPFAFFDMVRRRNVSGNAALVNTRIHNADARAEWFLGESDVLAITAYGKQFERPIERVIYGTSSLAGDISFQNSKAATLLGVELEARTSLGRLAKPLSPFAVGANVSFIYSQIQLDPDSPQTNATRPLQGQSPYVANAFLTWSKPEWGTEAGVFYNVYGPRISDVGFNGLADVVEQPFHRLDVTVTQRLGGGFQLKVAASNLLNQAVRLQQGGVDVLVNPPGVQVMGTLSWTFNEERK